MAELIEVDVTRRVGAFTLDARFASSAPVTAVFGRSGTGKTSFINVIAGIDRADRGRIEVNGEVLFDSERGVRVPAHRRRVGYVFQDARLFPHMTVQSNLVYGERLTPARERLIRFDTVVELLGLGELLDRRPGGLSGGEKQRVAIGRALLTSPRLLLMDEPLASLDPQRKNEVLRYIERLRDDVQIPIIYVSHSVDEVVRLADAVVVMVDGRVAAAGEVEDIMGRPDVGAAAGVFEGGTVIDARVTSQEAQYALATLAFDGGTLSVTNLDAAVGDQVRVRIRARDVSIALEAPRDISIQNIVAGEVTEVTAARAGVVDVCIAVGATRLRSRVTQRAVDRLALKPGLRVYALLKAVSLDRHGARAGR